MSDKAREDLADGLVAYARSFKEKAAEGHATAADVGAALKLLSHLGGEMNTDNAEVVATRDEVMESIRDLDLDTLH